ncbi:hypothetical protein ACQJBY_056312 [Aegilops geniculata]
MRRSSVAWLAMWPTLGRTSSSSPSRMAPGRRLTTRLLSSLRGGGRAQVENGVTGEDGTGVPMFAEYNLDELRASTDGFATDHIVFEHCEKEPNAICDGPSSALALPSPSSSSTAPPGLTHASSWRRLGQLGCCRAFACPTSSDDATRVASGCSLLSS